MQGRKGTKTISGYLPGTKEIGGKKTTKMLTEVGSYSQH